MSMVPSQRYHSGSASVTRARTLHPSPRFPSTCPPDWQSARSPRCRRPVRRHRRVHVWRLPQHHRADPGPGRPRARLADAAGVHRRAGARAAHPGATGHAGGLRRIQDTRAHWCGRRRDRDLPTVVRDDARAAAGVRAGSNHLLGARSAAGHGGGRHWHARESRSSASHAVVDPFAAVLFVGAVTVLLVWRVAPLRMVAGGAVLGVVRRRLVAAWGIRLSETSR